jgi:hypothetical protein
LSPAGLRVAAAAAALVLAVLSRGDALVLAALLAAAAWRPLPAIAVESALLATAWRWSSSSLDAIAGAQAVLGPAGWVGPGLAAAGSWLGASALLAATPGFRDPRAQLVSGAASGAAAAVIVAGPAPGGDVWVRVVAGVVAAAIAVVVGRWRVRTARAAIGLDAVAVVTGVAALAAVAREAGGWAGTWSSSAAGEGLAVAAGVTGVLVAGRRGWAAMEERRT